MEVRGQWRPWTPTLERSLITASRQAMLNTTSPSSLECLPPEIFQQILRLLSRHERACLAVCNRNLLRAVGTDIWTNDLASIDKKFVLLHLLSRDSSAWLCYRCKCSHYGRQMFPGLWHINPMRGASWRTIMFGNPRPQVFLGYPYCDFDMSTRAEIYGAQRVQRYASTLAYPDKWKSNLALNSTFSTITLPRDETLGHKHFVFWARYGRWDAWRSSGRSVFISEDGVDLHVNLDLCKHLSLRRTQPGENVIADILQCGWIMASHEYHGEKCSNATCRGGYRVPAGHEYCTKGKDNMRHSGACQYCPTEFVVEMWPHWNKLEKVLDIKVWHDLSDPGHGIRESPEQRHVTDGSRCNNPRRRFGILQYLWYDHVGS